MNKKALVFQFTHVEDLRTLMDSLHIKKAHIVGLSLGGFIGADMLGWFPERMSSAFLASGNIRKSKGPSQPMTKEEAAKRDEEIAAFFCSKVQFILLTGSIHISFLGCQQKGGMQVSASRSRTFTLPLYANSNNSV